LKDHVEQYLKILKSFALSLFFIAKMEKVSDLIQLLNLTDESTRIEAKTGSAIDKSIMQTICAFSNEPNLGGGNIILGITPDEMSLFPQYNVVGVENIDKLQSDLASQCASMFSIPVRPEIEIEKINDKYVMNIFVPELQPAQKPLFFLNEGIPKGAYRRIGSSDQRCSEEDLLVFYSHNETFDSTVIGDATISDLDENAIRQYRNLRGKVNPYAEELAFNDEELLIALGCLKRVGDQVRLTYTGLLVFGSSSAQRRLMPALRVDYIRVPGNEWISDPDDRFTTIDMRGSLILLIQRAYNAISDDLPKGFLLPEGQIQAATIGLPGRALREALVNAFIHRSFKVNQPIQIIRYGNRIEIKNPGYSLKPEDQLGDPGSNQRNPFIAAIFHETNLAETKGSGIRTMRRLMEQAGMVPPTFESNHTENQFTARLLLHHFLSEEDIRWLDSFSYVQLNDHQKQALVFVKEVGAIDNATYRQISGADILKASTDLRFLRDNGLLVAKGKGKTTYYTSGFDKGTGVLGEVTNGDIRVKELSGIPDRSGAIPDKKISIPDKGSNIPDKELGMEDSGIDEPELRELMKELPLELQERIVTLGKRSAERQEVEDVIQQICNIRPFRIKELSILLDRHIKHLHSSYLKPMIIRGVLKYAISDMPKHPDQAYISSKKNII
jgi:ATP-dependent DNA helicase RecG